METAKKLGVSRSSRGGAELRVPSPEGTGEFVVEHLGADLQKQMGAAWSPSHLLLLHQPLGDHLIDRRLHESGVIVSPIRYRSPKFGMRSSLLQM